MHHTRLGQPVIENLCPRMCECGERDERGGRGIGAVSSPGNFIHRTRDPKTRKPTVRRDFERTPSLKQGLTFFPSAVRVQDSQCSFPRECVIEEGSECGSGTPQAGAVSVPFGGM